MLAEQLKTALRDLAGWSDREDLLHERFGPASTVATTGAGTEVVDWIGIREPAEQSFRVGVLSGQLVTQRSWYEGIDAWEAAGRPGDPALRPRLVGMRGAARPLDGSDLPAHALAEAVIALHRAYLPGCWRSEEALAALANRVEAAMRGIVRAELAAAGVPDWLLADTGYDEAPAPRP